jgi:hypothetical protein
MHIMGVYCKEQYPFDVASGASIHDLKCIVCAHYQIKAESANIYQYNQETGNHKREPFPDDEAKLHDALGRNRWIQVTNLSKGKSGALLSEKGGSPAKGMVTYEDLEGQLRMDIDRGVAFKAYHTVCKGWFAISGIKETDEGDQWKVVWKDGDSTDTLKGADELARDGSAG